MTPGDRNYILTLSLTSGLDFVTMVTEVEKIAEAIRPHRYWAVRVDEWCRADTFNWTRIGTYPWP